MYDDNEKKEARSVYIIVYWEGPHIKQKIERICDSFQGQRYDLPEMNAIRDSMTRTEAGIKNARAVWMETKKQLRDQLEQFDKIEPENLDREQDKNVQSTMYVYKMFLAKEKALYRALNMMRLSNQTLIGYFWAPVYLKKEVFDISSNSPQSC